VTYILTSLDKHREMLEMLASRNVCFRTKNFYNTIQSIHMTSHELRGVRVKTVFVPI